MLKRPYCKTLIRDAEYSIVFSLITEGCLYVGVRLRQVQFVGNYQNDYQSVIS